MNYSCDVPIIRCGYGGENDVFSSWLPVSVQFIGTAEKLLLQKISSSPVSILKYVLHFIYIQYSSQYPFEFYDDLSLLI